MYNILHKVSYVLVSIGFETQRLRLCDSVCVIVSSGAPEWAEHINDTEKDVGSELTLRCVAVGKPLPWIRWLKDGYSVNTVLFCWGKPIWEPQIHVCIMCVMLHFIFCSTAKESWSSPVSRLRIRGCISVLPRMNGGASTPAPSFVSSVSF